MTQRSVTAWLAAVLWIGIIFSTIPFVRRLQEAFVVRWPAEVIGIGVILIVVVSTGIAIIALRRRPSPIQGVLWLLAAAAATVISISTLMKEPIESVHFIEYGVLGVLLHRALRLRINDSTVFVAAALAGTIVGTMDEIIQWIVPGRVFDFRDIALNGGASILVQIAIWRMTPTSQAPTRLRSVRLLNRLAAAWVLMLTFCISATPSRVLQTARYLPGFSTGNEAICEYGYLHLIDEKTRFRSRLSANDFGAIDGPRTREVAAALDGSRGAYKDFLFANPPTKDAFGYEARVHIFARDRNLAEARKLAADSPGFRERMTTAFRENLILETFFGDVLTRSSFSWPARKRDRIETAQDADMSFTSRVGSHLITKITEAGLRSFLLGIFAALVVCDLFVSTRLRTPPPVH